MISVVPSLPAQSFDEHRRLTQALEGAVFEHQVDIVDGQFVPLISWPFTEPNPSEALRLIAELPKSVAIEMDCMITNPEQYLDMFVSLSVARVVVHMRSTDAYQYIIEHARSNNYKIGFAFTNDVPLEEVTPFIERIDFVQVMGIQHVGKQGQPFDERTLDTVRELRGAYPSLEIAVDGSVNKETIVPLRDAGVTRFLPGSAVAKQDDPLAVYKELCALVGI